MIEVIYILQNYLLLNLQAQKVSHFFSLLIIKLSEIIMEYNAWILRCSCVQEVQLVHDYPAHKMKLAKTSIHP
ncbi:MAG: hypothetical protein AMS26_11125 [Bacteroides sp. SM23_62]|nr:MAG: hypothetical protein AMS26_11125 [Bacteroides sp. SM23_62]